MMPLKAFVSYSHKDAAHRERLEVHLAPLVREGLATFHDGRIPPGADLDAAIRRELREASIFIALASPDYLKSDYCYIKEYGYARRRAARKTMFVVAVILRPCGWKSTRMARYKSLPRDGREVTLWANRDAAYEDVVGGLRRVIAEAVAEKGKATGQAAAAKGAEKRPKRASAKAVRTPGVRPSAGVRKAKAAVEKATPAPGRAHSPKANASRPSARRPVKHARRTPTPG